MSFMIEFPQRFAESSESHIAVGEITLGRHQETFQADLSHWERGHYESSWRENVGRILDGHERAALISSITDPATANFIFWWPMYRTAEGVTIQNQMLLLEELEEPFDPTRPWDFVTRHENVDEDGERVSEWTLPLQALSNYLAHP
ncbi:hypothetical protein ACWCP6_05940 [Streptomyces sp. NPDC002004]